MKQPAAYVLMLLAMLGASCPFGPGDDTIDIDGHVYAAVALCSQGQNCEPSPAGPAVGGAVVSTSLDGQTAVTDASGYFELKSSSSPDTCEKYTITIHATGYPTYAITRPWGFRAPDQLFGLSPPFPNEENQQCSR